MNQNKGLIKTYKGKLVTVVMIVAFRTSDGYFLGFRDMYNGVPRANFVSDEFLKLKNSDLFSGAVRKQLPYSSSYASMESTTKLGKSGREKLALGVQDLSLLIKKVYGEAYRKDGNPKKDINEQLAKFGLTVVQIVAEAARFKYIENEEINGGLGTNNFKPSDVMIALEKEWGKISQAIHISSTSKSPCENLEDKKFTLPEVDTVEKLRPYITVIKFKDSKKFEAGNNTVIDLMEVMEPEFM